MFVFLIAKQGFYGEKKSVFNDKKDLLKFLKLGKISNNTFQFSENFSKNMLHLNKIEDSLISVTSINTFQNKKGDLVDSNKLKHRILIYTHIFFT